MANGRHPASRIYVINIDIRGEGGVSQSTCHARLLMHDFVHPPSRRTTFSLPQLYPLGHACKMKPGTMSVCLRHRISGGGGTVTHRQQQSLVALADTIMRRTRGTDKCISPGLASGELIHRNGVMDYYEYSCSRRRTGWRSLKREVFARRSRATCRSVTNFRATPVCIQITGLCHRSESRRTSLTGQNARIPHESIRPPRGLYASF